MRSHLLIVKIHGFCSVAMQSASCLSASIRRADIVLLFLDATQGITRLDKQLADYIATEQKPCIFTINKWDLIERSADPTLRHKTCQLRSVCIPVWAVIKAIGM